MNFLNKNGNNIYHRFFLVPEVRGKADLTKYRNAGQYFEASLQSLQNYAYSQCAGKEVIKVLLEFGAIVERASIDEAYVDLTNIVDEKMTQVRLGFTIIFYPKFLSKDLVFQNYTQENLIDQLNNTFVVGYDESDEDRKSGYLITFNT